jgi:hypothetical protein
MQRTVLVNSAGVMGASRLHARGGKVVNLTSVLGSIEAARDRAGYLTYGMQRSAPIPRPTAR